MSDRPVPTRGAREASWKLLPAGLLLRGAATIRRKLIVLHTLFSLGMAAALLLALRQPVQELLQEEESRECRLAVEALAVPGPRRDEPARLDLPGVDARIGPADSMRSQLPPELDRLATGSPDRTITAVDAASGSAVAARYNSRTGEMAVAVVRSPGARAAVNRLYILLTVAMLGVYAVIAATLEVFVLPRQVYAPIARLRAADDAVRQGRREDELIPDSMIPSDEIGDIMRSRNQSIAALRHKEKALEVALTQLEQVASELKRKNHLLETARRNLADQDRLASLGMMSAGIAHELNTPLAVLKGSVEQIARESLPEADGSERAALMLRVVNRLERLSESLLDFARARPPKLEEVSPRHIVDEAWTLVALDRDASSVEIVNAISPDLRLMADGDRLTQVFVNLLRNAVDAMAAARAHPPGRHPSAIRVRSQTTQRDGRPWVSLTVTDRGPGIDPELFPRLFEPFASTRLDAQGTGLGLAVAEGIVREHGGLILARNAGTGDPGGGGGGVGSADGFTGAEFEVMLPVGGPEPEPTLFESTPASASLR